MRNLSLSALLLLCFAAAAMATSTTVASYTIPNVQYPSGTVPVLRVYVTGGTFTTSDGRILRASQVGSTTIYQSVTCSYNFSTKVVTIPSFTIDTTSDALVGAANAAYTAAFFIGNTQKEFWMSAFRVPLSLGSNTTWPLIVGVNAAPNQRPAPLAYATVDYVNNAIRNLGPAAVATTTSEGTARLDSAPGDSAHPVVVTTTSPLIKQLFGASIGSVPGSSYVFLADTYSVFNLTLTTNVTSSTITYTGLAGKLIVVSVKQDGTGSRTFAWPSSFLNAPTVTAAANSITSTTFVFDGTNWKPITSVSAPGNNSLPVNPKDYGAIADGSSHPLSGVYETLAAAQAVYPFVTSLSQEIDYVAVKQASNVAFGADLVAGTYHTPDGNSTTTLIKDSINLVADHSLIGQSLFMRYPNGFIASVIITDNVAVAGIEQITIPALPFDFHNGAGIVCGFAQLFDCSQYAIGNAGEHGFSNAYLNKPLFLPGGTYVFGADEWLIRNLSGGTIYGAGRTSTILTGSGTVFGTDGLWYSQITGISFHRTAGGTGRTVDIDGNVPGHPYATRSVQGNTFKDIEVDGAEATEAMYMCRQGGAGAQCSENLFLDVHFQRADILFSILGANALNTTFIGGNFQDFNTGAFFNGGSAAFYKVAFQSTRGYTQISAGGADIDASTFGVNDTIIDDGSDSESLVHHKGGASQIAYVRGLVQRCGSCFTWSAAASVTLNQIYQSTVDTSLLYRVTTAGTTAGSLPVFTGATVNDGTAVWTQVSFISNTIAAGYMDGTDGVRGPGGFIGALRQNARTVEVTGLSAYTVALHVEHVLVNAAGQDVTVTLPATFVNTNTSHGARVTVSQYAGVSQAGHTVTVTAQTGIEGGDYVIPGTGGGAATFVRNGGGDLTQRYYRIGGTDARTVNGAKVYRALITQSSTGAPTALVLENSFGGTFVLARTSAGIYTVTLAGAFPASKEFFMPNNVALASGTFNIVRTSDNVLTITVDTDGLLTAFPLEIRVYQ